MNKLVTRLAPLLGALALGCAATDFGHGTGPGFDKRLADLVRPLNTGERAVLDKNGLVISPEARANSFHLGYTAIFKAHEPVYFTADALLHALHSSYDAILADVETDALSTELATLLKELRAGLGKSAASAEVRADLDLYLGVAAGLLEEKPVAPVAGAKASEIASLVDAARKAGDPADTRLFGEAMLVDFSMMKPRGHYTRSPLLTRYFQAMMWLGRTEIRIAKKVQGEWQVNRRALAATALLRDLLTDRAELAWRRIDETTLAFVGPSDSMSFPAFTRAIKGAGLARGQDLLGLADADVAKALEKESTQKIGSQLLHPGEHPIAFLPLGQRYVFDSEVFSAVVYGQLPVKRMMPSPLDVGWGVFRSQTALDLLKPELTAYGYRSALDAVAKRGDDAGADLWEGSIYHLWLRALRELSPDRERDAGLPAVMQSDAWGRRMLASELASWAELRHDNLLYAKQSFTAMALCEYPDAYVEPYPAFFKALEKLAKKGTTLVGNLEFGQGEAQKKRITEYFKRYGEVAGKLGEMAELERDKKPLRSDDIDFLNHAVSVDGKHAGCTMILEPGGWYAGLHYDRDDVLWHKPTIADVHTQPTDENGNMVGKVLHVGTTRPRLMTVTLETCSGKVTYKGFVSAYHEVVTGGFERLSDEEWETKIEKDKGAPEVPWMGEIVAR